jgi:hypothetical protein
VSVTLGGILFGRTARTFRERAAQPHRPEPKAGRHGRGLSVFSTGALGRQVDALQTLERAVTIVGR